MRRVLDLDHAVIPMFDRVWARVRKEPGTSGCWLYTGAISSTGYGVLTIEGIHYGAHRAAWMSKRGSIPAGLNVLHRCDVRHCVRLKHLFLGTDSDNMQDALAKGRLALGLQRHNARFSDEDVRVMRRLYASGLTLTEIGIRFDARCSTIGNITAGRSRRGVR